MRCLSCGEEMAVTASRDQPPAPQPQAEVSSAAPTAVAENEPPVEAEFAIHSPAALPEEATHDAPAPMLVPAAAWTRAVEKLRHRQADLNLRAQEAKKANWNYRFDRVWQRLVPDYPEFSRPNAAHKKIRRRAWSPQASARSVIPRRRPVIEIPVVESSPEKIHKFNEFWDSLVPRQPPPVSNESPLAPLPKSVSLVPIESAPVASAASRAILLPRGPYPDRIAA
jgi:hypothetical protein